MATEPDYSIDDILSVEELENLGSPHSVWEMPEAQVFEWDDEIAVATPGFSIASSMDRFAGPMNRPQFQALEGFNSEFTENGRRVVIAGDELRAMVGDQAIARIEGFDESYAVDVRSPDEVIDKIREYHENYSGDVKGDFLSRLDDNNAVLPVIYSNDGVVAQRGVALMEGDGVMMSSDESPEEIFERLEQGKVQNDIHVDRYEAPDSAEAEYFVDVMLPSNYEDVDHALVNQGLVIEVDEEQVMESFLGDREVHNYSENNGLYTVELV